MRRAAIALFLCLALHSALANIEDAEPTNVSSEGGGSGSGGSGSDQWDDYTPSGSGSGEGVGCAGAPSSEDGEGDNITSSSAYAAVTCYLLCIQDVYNHADYQSAQFGSREVGDVWRFLFFSDFNTPVNRTDSCPAYREFNECVRGCLVPETTGLTGKQCKQECKGDCDEEFSKDSTYNQYCDINCNLGDCKQGCDNHDHIERSQNTPGSPARPVSAPVLVPSQDSEQTGQFFVSLSHSAPRTNNQEHPLSPVAVVYRIQDQKTHVTMFHSQVHPEQPLSLKEFACRNVTVSFVVVNQYGASHESPTLSLTVPADPVSIGAPTDVVVSTEVDKRPGFFGHAVLTVSWQHPPDYVQGIYHYIVKVFRVNSIAVYSSPPQTTTTLTVQSDEVNDAIFHLESHLEIQVYTVVGEEEEFTRKDYQTPTFNSIIKMPMEITACTAHWNGSMFNYTLHWRVPEFIAYGSRIVNDFLVDANLQFEGKTLLLFSTDLIQKQPDQTLYEYTWINFEPQAPEKIYKFSVSIQWVRSDVYNQPSVVSEICERQAIPPPPSPVLNVMTSAPSFSDGNIRFDFQWEPPSTTNGHLTSYLACLGGRVLSQHEDYDPAQPDDGNDTKCSSISSTSTSYVWVHRKSRPECLYFQLRAHTLHRSGEWSKVVVISNKSPNSDDAESCDATPTMSPSPTPAAHTSPSDILVPVTAAVGMVLVIIVIVVLTIITVVCSKVRRRKLRLQHFLKRQRSDQANLMFTGGTKQALTPQMEHLITTDEWEVSPSQVIVGENLGEGAFGEVLKGTVMGPLSNPKVPGALKNAICIPVAIKMLKSSAKGSERRDFLQEIEMMKKVSEGHNRHVVSMVGCVTLQEPLCLITEFIPYGNLLQYLRTNRRMYTESGEGAEDNPYVGLGNVSSLDLISFAYQIASGMEYLSSLGIVHRDLACRNILVGEGKVLKITDLGMSRETDEIYVQKTKGRVPLKWMAVESIVTREFTSASDVWAYGVVLWEIGTLGGFPYPSVQNEDLLPLLKHGYRMEKPDNCSTEVYAIMLECWQEEPGKRPTFSKLRTRFDSMLLAEKKETYIDLQIDASKPYYNPEDSECEPKQNDGFLHVAAKSSKSSSRVSITSPFHYKGKSPSHSNCSDPPAILRGQRAPRSLSPAPVTEKLPRPASLQLLTERKNANHYVDDPSTRRSIHISPPDWASMGYRGGASDGSIPVDSLEVGGNWNGAVGRGAHSRGEAADVPDIFISFS